MIKLPQKCSRKAHAPDRESYSRSGNIVKSLGGTVCGLIAGVTLATTAHADEGIVVPHAGMLDYAISDNNLVYIRNLNQINSAWQGCCTYYWLDISSNYGMAQFSAFLTAKATNGPISFWIVTKAGGKFLQVGNF